MKKRLLLFLATYALFLALFVIEKPLFMARYHALFPTATAADWGDVMLHGLPLDLSLAAYLTIIPALFLIISCWYTGKRLRQTARVYFALTSTVTAAVCIIDLGLYEFWGFRLDATPLFYFLSSPKDAFASVSIGFLCLGAAAIAVMSLVQYLLLSRLLLRFRLEPLTDGGKKSTPVKATLVLVLLTAALFIPIRGGVTVSTMNVGKVYYSNNIRLNHAAINPLFSLMESLAKQKDFAAQYRFLEPDEANSLFRNLQDPQARNYAQAPTAYNPEARADTANTATEILTTTPHLLRRSLTGKSWSESMVS